jgi:methionyl-tRNA formyltransferase
MNTQPLSFAFWGTPEVAATTLAMLISEGYMPRVVITNPDRQSGRGLAFTPSPTALLARAHGITVLQPENIDAGFIAELGRYGIELSIVVAYGKLLPNAAINLPKKGTLNIHYSLLPLYRGASPLEAALLHGNTETGVTIQKMVYALDAGDIVAQKSVPIGATVEKEVLRKQLVTEGAELLIASLPAYLRGVTTLIAQDETRATRCGKIAKEDGMIELTDNPQTLYNKYRAYSGWPGIYFFRTYRDKNMRIKITKASYANSAFTIERVVPEGKKEMSYEQFLAMVSGH